MGVYFIKTKTRPCAYVRCELPARAMFKRGVTSVGSQIVQIDGDGLPLKHEKFPVWVFQIPNDLGNLVGLAHLLRKMGKAVVVEFDDDYFNYPTNNRQTVADVVDLGAVKSRMDILKLAHMVTVSTPELVPIYKRYNDNVVVLPNCIDLADFPKRRNDRKRIVVGWAGAQKCGNEVQILPALEQLVKENLKVDIAIGGDRACTTP